MLRFVLMLCLCVWIAFLFDVRLCALFVIYCVAWSACVCFDACVCVMLYVRVLCSVH